MQKLHKLFDKEVVVSQLTQLLDKGPLLVVMPYDENSKQTLGGLKPNIVYGHCF